MFKLFSYLTHLHSDFDAKIEFGNEFCHKKKLDHWNHSYLKYLLKSYCRKGLKSTYGLYSVFIFQTQEFVKCVIMMGMKPTGLDSILLLPPGMMR